MVGSFLGRANTRSALAQLLPPEHTPTPLALADLFSAHLNTYAEVVLHQDARAAGFVTRGEDANFTERVRTALEQLGMDERAIAHHDALASWFEHRRGFIKLEWRVQDAGVDPMASCYFRRRPAIAAAMTRLADLGMSREARELAVEVAGILDKPTIHFVAAAFRVGQPVVHKLYFSQYVTPDTRAQVSARIARVFERLAMPDALVDLWRHHHDRSLPAAESTVLVSIRADESGVAPSLKLDYPMVPPARAVAWLAEGEREPALAHAQRATALTGVGKFSYFGVTFRADRAQPSLKYYCDVTRAGQPIEERP